MIKRPTWILLVILALAVGAYYLIKNRPAKLVEPTPTAIGNNYLITQADGTLQKIFIQDSQGLAVQMQRDISGSWIMILPTPGAADQASASAAETQIGALLIVTMLELSPNPGTMGLDTPEFTIELGFVSDAEHKLEVGTMTPTGSGYYVRFDDGDVYVVSQSGIDSVLNLLTAPPYIATETPSPSIEPTSTPTLGTASPTP